MRSREIWCNSCIGILSLLTFLQNVNCAMYNGKIAGNKSISECINGDDKKVHSELDMTPSEKIKLEGYPVTEHLVLTEDGYLLTIFRIPGPEGSTPVYLQHGVAMSAYDWVNGRKDQALAFYLADQGYDVWIGNFRGSPYASCHTTYTTSDYSFWNYSFEELGNYDLPTQLTYVASETNKELLYVGHSMGTTAFYVMAIEKPDIAAKVKAMFALAPVAFMYNIRSSNQVWAPYARLFRIVFRYLRAGELLDIESWRFIVKNFCDRFSFVKTICVDTLFLVVGLDAPQFNYTRSAEILGHVPTNTAYKPVEHYSQFVVSGKFRKFDYGFFGNRKMYGSSEPPNFDLSKIQVPIGFFWSDNDYLATPKDVAHLMSLVPKKIISYRVPYDKFNHIDFLLAIDARTLLYRKLLSVMENYR